MPVSMSLSRLVHVVISLAPGGLERLVMRWANARNQKEWGSTRIVCLDQLGDLAAAVEGDAVECLSAKRARFPWDQQAARALRRLGTDSVLHCHNLAALQYGVLASWRQPIPLIYTQHGANVHDLSPINRVRSHLLLRQADVVVAVSEATADAMARQYVFPRRRIRVLPNGVTPHVAASASEQARLRSLWGLKADDRVMGSVGRLAYVKGQDRLLRAFARWRQEDEAARQWKLLLVGDGPERGTLEGVCERLGLGGAVVWAGFMPDARPALDLMDLFVLPSRSEGLSVALLEAAAAGVPVAVTNVGANKEVIAGGEAGWLLAEDEGAWPASLAEINRQKEERARRAAVGRERVERLYGLEQTLAGYERLYEKLKRHA